MVISFVYTPAHSGGFVGSDTSRNRVVPARPETPSRAGSPAALHQSRHVRATGNGRGRGLSFARKCCSNAAVPKTAWTGRPLRCETNFKAPSALNASLPRIWHHPWRVRNWGRCCLFTLPSGNR